MKEYPELIKVI